MWYKKGLCKAVAAFVDADKKTNENINFSTMFFHLERNPTVLMPRLITVDETSNSLKVTGSQWLCSKLSDVNIISGKVMFIIFRDTKEISIDENNNWGILRTSSQPVKLEKH